MSNQTPQPGRQIGVVIWLIIAIIVALFLLFRSKEARGQDILKPNTFELKPHIGLMNVVSTEYENLQNRDLFSALRIGFHSSLTITPWMKFKFDAGGEWNNLESFAISCQYFEIAKGKFKAKTGYSATPITCFRPHPISIQSQAEYVSSKQIQAGAYHLTLNYKINDASEVTLAAAERGNSLGDSTEYSFVFGNKNSKAGIYFLDGNFGAVLKYITPQEDFTSLVYYRQNLITSYFELLLGKENNLLFALDMIYDYEKGQTEFTQDKYFFGEFIFLYMFDVKSPLNNNFSGGIGPGITKDCFNLYLFVKIL